MKINKKKAKKLLNDMINMNGYCEYCKHNENQCDGWCTGITATKFEFSKQGFKEFLEVLKYS